MNKWRISKYVAFSSLKHLIQFFFFFSLLSSSLLQSYVELFLKWKSFGCGALNAVVCVYCFACCCHEHTLLPQGRRSREKRLIYVDVKVYFTYFSCSVYVLNHSLNENASGMAAVINVLCGFIVSFFGFELFFFRMAKL